MIEARDLTKIYGGKAAVDHLSFAVEPGQVTGFLGPNGAGKSTTMRLILFAAWRPRPSGRGGNAASFPRVSLVCSGCGGKLACCEDGV